MQRPVRPSLPLRVLCAAGVFLCCAALAARAQESRKAGPVFKDGQAQVVPAFADPNQWIHEELWVETSFDSDGNGKPDRMHVDVTRPRQTGSEGLKVPVVYESSPYFAGIGSTEKQYFWDPKHELGSPPASRPAMPPIEFADRKARRGVVSPSLVRTWVPRGFAVVHSESPGTGLSQGCPTCGADNEALAPKAVIDWLNGRARGFTAPDGNEEIKATWCTGKVGMTGTSYNGTLTIAAATTGVEGLAAIVPDAPNTSYYHYYRSNGLIRHPGGYMGEDIDVLYEFINSGDPARRDWCNQQVREAELHAHQDRLTGDFSDFWAGRDYALKLDNLKAATLMVHGFNDWNVMPEHSIRIYQVLKQKGIPHMAYFHQGGHGAQVPMKLMNRWFTRFLYGVDNGVEKDPKAWIVREGDKPSEPTAYDEYPNPAAQPVVLHPHVGGNKVGGLGGALRSGEHQESLVDDVGKTGGQLARAAESEHRLLYATAPLSAPVHISGTPRVRIRLAADKPAANLSVWLVALRTVADKTRSEIITRGWADPQNHKSLRESQPLVPGQFVELAFDLQPDDQVVPEDSRIALMIFSSDQEFTLWPKPGTKLTVNLDATTLELPVVGGAEAFAKATVERAAPTEPAEAKGTLADARALLQKFLDPAADRAALVAALRPAPADYQALYVGDAVHKAQPEYERLWQRMGQTDGGIAPKDGQTELKVWSATTEDLRAWNDAAQQFPGGYKDVAQQLAPGVTWYRFKFVKPGEDAGMAFDALVFVHQHWILVPRPWRPLK